MKKANPITVLIITAAAVLAGTVIFYFLFHVAGGPVFQALYITFLTTLYHLIMRLAVGECVSVLCRGHCFDYDAPWFRPKKWEAGLYRRLGVKRWKKTVITAKPEQFDPKVRTPEELVFYMTQAEIVHEIIMVLSWAPVLLIGPFGEPAVFIITSALACLADGAFVAIQRYNRPRILKILRRREK